MYGIEAITYYNGWAMAVAGGAIVLTGLMVLSFVISQLHRIAGFLERREEKLLAAPGEAPEPETLEAPKQIERFPVDLNQTAQEYQRLTEDLGACFLLSELYLLCQQNKMPHPHLTIKYLRDAGLLVPEGDGVFSWN